MDLSHLLAAAGPHPYLSTNGNPPFGPHQPQTQPAVIRLAVVAQQGRRIVQVHNENIDIAVVVVIAHCRGAAHLLQLPHGPALLSHLPEPPALVAVEQIALGVTQIGVALV